MVRHDNDDALDPLEREAYAWIRRLTSGEATSADVDASPVADHMRGSGR